MNTKAHMVYDRTIPEIKLSRLNNVKVKSEKPLGGLTWVLFILIMFVCLYVMFILLRNLWRMI